MPTYTDTLTHRQAARILGIHYNTVTAWKQRGILKGVTLPGGAKRITRESVRRVLEGVTEDE